MNDMIKMILDKDFLKKRVPLWHILILTCVVLCDWKLSELKAGIFDANKSLGDHGRRLDQIDDALYYKLDINVRAPRTGTPRQNGNSGMTENTNKTLAKIQKN